MLVSLINARDQESARVSRVLHDDVGQILSAVGLKLDLFRLDLRDRAPEVDSRTADIQQLLERAITRVRELSYDLNPAVVEKAGLQFALERLVGRYRQRFPGSLRLLIRMPERLPAEVASALYKIADQALANAVDHARCSHIEVLVKPARKGAVLEVRDSGVGFAVEQVREHSPGIGLLAMEYYASQAGLQLSITSAPGKGTIVKVSYSAPGVASLV